MWCDLPLWAMKAYNLPLLVKLSDPAASFQWNIKHKPLHLLNPHLQQWSVALQRYKAGITLAQPSSQIKGACISHPFWAHHSREVLLKELGFGSAEMLPMGAAQGQTQPPAGIKLEEGSAAGTGMPGTALQVWSPFLLLILTRFHSR